MVVKEDGTKWACASCLKGHRVSGCTHVDRELTFVPKKGRPVTQCPHCRSERKKRSAHVKCECGEKSHPKEKCIHLREAEAKAAAAATTSAAGITTNNTTPESDDSHTIAHDLGTLPEELFADDHHCCCPHGGKCTCATKESPEPRVESPPKISHSRPRPRLTSHQSEGHLTVFTNGHHKPVHRHNNAAHEGGAPYKLPRSHSHTTSGAPNIARRSVDSLASIKSMSPIAWQQLLSANPMPIQQEPHKAQPERDPPQSDPSTRHQSPFDVLPMPLENMPLETAPFTAPEVSSSANSGVYQEFGFPSSQSALSVATTSTEPAMSVFSMPTSGLDFDSGANEYWSAYDWNKPSNNTMETQPALTNASSGTISEIDDLPRVDDLSGFDAQYSMDGQGQMSAFEFGNDYSDNRSFRSSYTANANSSNRWSMPSFSSQNNGVAFLPLTNDTTSKDLSMQPFGATQPVLQNQPQTFVTSVASSSHSQSPQPQGSENLFPVKESSSESYDWDSLMPEYGASMIAGSDAVDNSLGFGVGDSVQGCTTGIQANGVENGGGSLEGFNNSYRTMQWDDGMPMPADQDYSNMYNFDSNWGTGTFGTSWS